MAANLIDEHSIVATPSVLAFSATNLDVRQLADNFYARVQGEKAEAFMRLTHILHVLPTNLHSTFRRIISSKLTWQTRALLNCTPEGRAMLLRQMIDAASVPMAPTLPFLTPALAHDFFGSLVQERGSHAARKALNSGEPLLVALRRESSTLRNNGQGSYDDQVAVLRGVGKARSARVFPICTEPGAQYSQRSAPKGTGRVDARYAHVRHRKADGIDINKDGIKDAGRLIAGAYEYFEKVGGFLGGRAFRVRITQVVERDTNGDGRFTKSDPDRIDSTGAGTTMYIHRGGALGKNLENTWSAGCQTVPTNVYPHFLGELGSSRRFFYVLINAR